MDKYIYLDNNATTQMAPEVKQIMRENEDLYGNASSMHAMGRMAESAIAWARGEVKSLIGASAEDEVYFISGSTEGNNTVFNTFRDLIDDGSRKDRILLSTVEHPASIETAKYLKKKGYKIDYIPVDRIGMVEIQIQAERNDGKNERDDQQIEAFFPGQPQEQRPDDIELLFDTKAP